MLFKFKINNKIIILSAIVVLTLILSYQAVQWFSVIAPIIKTVFILTHQLELMGKGHQEREIKEHQVTLQMKGVQILEILLLEEQIYHYHLLLMELDLHGAVAILSFIADALYSPQIVGQIVIAAEVAEEGDLITQLFLMEVVIPLTLAVETIFMIFLRMHFMRKAGIDKAHPSIIGP